MSAHRLKLLNLMACRTQFDMGQLSGRLNGLRQIELQQFDLTERLNALLTPVASAGHTQLTTRGALGTAQYMQQTVLDQIEILREKSAQTRAERHAVETELNQNHQKRRVLQDRATATRQSLQQSRAE